MSYALDILARPTVEIVSLASAKAQVRVLTDETDEDSLITALILAATEYAETYTRRIYRETSFRMYMDSFPKGRNGFFLRRSPLVTLDQITYYDDDGVQQTLSTDVYTNDSGMSVPARVFLKPDQVWPDTEPGHLNAVEIDFSCGYRDTLTSPSAGVPDVVCQAILLLVAHWFENREGTVVGTSAQELPLSVTNLLDIEKIVEFPGG